MKRAALLLLIAGLAGCAPVRYQAAPVDPARYPAARSVTHLEQPVGAVWSAADLLDAALTNNPQVAEAWAKYQTALAAAAVSRQGPTANLTLTAEYSKDAGGTSPWLLGVGTDLPFDRGVRREARLTTADLNALQARYDYGEAIWTVRMAVVRAYADLVRSRDEAPLAQQAAALRRDRFERLNRRVAAGEDARPAALLAQTELFTAERRATDARARQTQAELALAQALGVNPSQVGALALAAPPVPDLANVAAWTSEAALSRRDVLRAIADYDLAEAALRLEVAKQFPEVRIGPGYTWERGVTKLPFNLSLALPPADFNRAAIRQAEAKRAEAGKSLEAVQATVLATAEQANAALGVARDNQKRAYGSDLRLARITAEQQTHAFAAGEMDRTDQLAAQAVAAEAALAALDSDRAADLATLTLEDALRRPLDAQETVLLRAKADTGAAP